MKGFSYKQGLIFFTLITWIFLGFNAAVLAATQPSEPLMAPGGNFIVALNGYKITDYEVNIRVQEDAVLEVTEGITVYFDEPKHGIYRKLPLENKIFGNMGQETAIPIQKAKVSHLSVKDGTTGQELSVEKETQSGQLVLKIGDSGEVITGEKTYVLHYRYVMGNAGMKHVDAFYYSLIGDEWDTYIGNVRFSIEMPKTFDGKGLFFMIGGTAAGQQVAYQIHGNTISGRADDVLGSGRGLHVRLELPQGYFYSKEKTGLGASGWLALLFMAASGGLFGMYGRNSRNLSVRFQGIDFNPAEAGYFLGGEFEKRGKIALLLYWAEKGYLCFEQTEQGNVLLRKLKDAEGEMKSYEEPLFKALFANGNPVAPEALRTQFTGVMDRVGQEMHRYFREPSHWLHTKASDRARWVSYLCTLFCIGLVADKLFGEAYSLTDFLTIGVCFITFAVFSFPFIALISYHQKKDGIGSKTGLVVAVACFLLILLFIVGLLAYAGALDIDAGLVVLAVGVCGMLGTVTRRRTDFGNQMFSQIDQCKRQLEKRQQTALSTQDTFYSLLPYAYLFGLSDAWAKAFDNLELGPPEWFKQRLIQLYSTLYFSNLMSDQLNSFESNMTYNDSSGSDGGGGGGSGGGGGGSW